MRLFIYPYKQGSASAKALAEAMGAKRIKREGSRFKPALHKQVINWGARGLPNEILSWCQVINHPVCVGIAGDKFKALDQMSRRGVQVVPFTNDYHVALTQWDDQRTIVVRHKLNGHSGEGIELIDPGDDLPKAPLYTQYVKKKEEYRFHVCNGGTFHVQRKARRLETPDDEVDWKVRNHRNGFIYQQENVEVHGKAHDLAIEAVDALDLDFGAVDIIYNEKKDEYYVLEVNTAPGLFGTTLQKYAETLKHFLDNPV
jgi:glutathione synthase/RimK-type ligase-like ATP-grasp enzyme